LTLNQETKEQENEKNTTGKKDTECNEISENRGQLSDLLFLAIILAQRR
jgi:hypothetical protein